MKCKMVDKLLILWFKSDMAVQNEVGDQTDNRKPKCLKFITWYIHYKLLNWVSNVTKIDWIARMITILKYQVLSNFSNTTLDLNWNENNLFYSTKINWVISYEISKKNLLEKQFNSAHWFKILISFQIST